MLLEASSYSNVDSMDYDVFRGISENIKTKFQCSYPLIHFQIFSYRNSQISM